MTRWHRAMDVVQPAVLEEEDGIIVLDAGNQQAFGIVRRRRHHHFEPGNVRKPGMQAL